MMRRRDVFAPSTTTSNYRCLSAASHTTPANGYGYFGSAKLYTDTVCKEPAALGAGLVAVCAGKCDCRPQSFISPDNQITTDISSVPTTMSAPPAPCPLLSVLPPELIYLITNTLPTRSAALFARTCRAAHALLAPQLDRQFQSAQYLLLLWSAQHNRPYTLARCLHLLHRPATTSHTEHRDAALLEISTIFALPPDTVSGRGSGRRKIEAILLDEAIRGGCADALRVLLAHGVDPNRGPPVVGGGCPPPPPLTAAVLQQDVAAAEMLLAAGADANGNSGLWSASCCPPIVLACWERNWEMVGLLERYGAVRESRAGAESYAVMRV
ncbi:hypothetical protein DFP73DRAFT_585740 [Morchella snyderi]|nr:hypothetical protein DFP73DRAFT_585740 [Morchella snyderi]